MTVLTALLVLQSPSIRDPQAFLLSLRRAVGSGVERQITPYFAREADAGYLFEMAGDRAGLRDVKVFVFPAPPGWESTGKYWAVFSTRQDLEEHHDPVHPVIQTADGFRLGREIKEFDGVEWRPKHANIDVRLVPSQNRVSVKTEMTFTGQMTKAPILRLQPEYQLSAFRFDPSTSSEVTVAGDTVPEPKPGSVLRAGSLLIPWSTSLKPNVRFEYSGVVNTQREDKVTPKVAYVTAWWIPTQGRLPHTTTTRVVGPKDWVLQSEGPRTDPASFKMQGAHEPTADEKVEGFKCDIPISYPKVIGGQYTLAAEKRDGDMVYRSYHLDGGEKARGERDVAIMADAVRFFEKTIGPFPFKEYSCYDSDTYYGIESYSYTLLQKGITTRFVAHEIAHTYFGGLVPSTYVRDTWNEGLTQYVDSVLFSKNADRSLETGLNTVNLPLALNRMAHAHGNGSATYYRGAYVMKMLEAEIGPDIVIEGLRSMVKDRVGKDTLWADLRMYFEKPAGKKLDWFWQQWVESPTFPTLQIVDAEPINREGKWRTRLTVRQSGSAEPYRLRFLVRVRRGPQTAQQLVEMNSPEAIFSVDSDFQPTGAEIDPFPHALVHVKPYTQR